MNTNNHMFVPGVNYSASIPFRGPSAMYLVYNFGQYTPTVGLSNSIARQACNGSGYQTVDHRYLYAQKFAQYSQYNNNFQSWIYQQHLRSQSLAAERHEGISNTVCRPEAQSELYSSETDEPPESASEKDERYEFTTSSSSLDDGICENQDSNPIHNETTNSSDPKKNLSPMRSRQKKRRDRQKPQIRKSQKNNNSDQPPENIRKDISRKTDCLNTKVSNDTRKTQKVASAGKTIPSSTESSSPTASPKAKRINKDHRLVQSPFALVNILSEFAIGTYLQKYILADRDLRWFGYPVESPVFRGCIEIYKYAPGLYVPPTRTIERNFIQRNPHERKFSTDDSGNSSGSSSPSLHSNDSDSDEDIFVRIMKRKCVRCRKLFEVTSDGEYVTKESCKFHWGKPESSEYVNEKGETILGFSYSCCKKNQTEPCSENHVHVWTDISNGLNGPFTDFVYTRLKRHLASVDIKIYALDCEMSYTAFGMEVTKVTVVSYDGKLAYNSIVYPKAEVGDYNTRFSGISERDFQSPEKVRTLEMVQKDLIDLIDAEDILIGHGLDNDLKVLKLVHRRCVDTSLVYPHPNGFPYRRALKSIVFEELGRKIQTEEEGHSSFEDSRACLELMLLKVSDDWIEKMNS